MEGEENEPSEAEDEPSEAEVVAYLSMVAHRVASRIAEAVEDPELRAHAVKAAAEVLETDEGALDLLRAAFDEGRAESARAVIASGGLGAPAPDWSDIESAGERRLIAREESICGTCTRAPVCAVVASAQQLGVLQVIRRCDAFFR